MKMETFWGMFGGVILGYTYLNSKKKKPKSIEKEIDRGFIYDCKSLQITNKILFSKFKDDIVLSLAKTDEFFNPETFDVRKFTDKCLEKFSKKCYTKIITSKTINEDESLILGFLTVMFTNSYLHLIFGSDMVGVGMMINPDELLSPGQKAYVDYYLAIINPQLTKILSSFKLSMDYIQKLGNQLESEGKIP